MTETKFTPGPWHTKKAGNGDIAIMHGANHILGECYESIRCANEGAFAECEANAHLIASSPSLYTEAERLLSHYDPEVGVIRVEPDPGCIVCTSGTTPNDRNTGLCPFHGLRVAMKQARGES